MLIFAGSKLIPHTIHVKEERKEAREILEEANQAFNDEEWTDARSYAKKLTGNHFWEYSFPETSKATADIVNEAAKIVEDSEKEIAEIIDGLMQEIETAYNEKNWKAVMDKYDEIDKIASYGQIPDKIWEYVGEAGDVLDAEVREKFEITGLYIDGPDPDNGYNFEIGFKNGSNKKISRIYFDVTFFDSNRKKCKPDGVLFDPPYIYDKPVEPGQIVRPQDTFWGKFYCYDGVISKYRFEGIKILYSDGTTWELNEDELNAVW